MTTAATKDPRLQAHDPEGLNTGAPPALLRDPITPVSLFFTRSHAPAPAIDLESYRLRIRGLVRSALELSWDDLSRIPRREVTATLVCAGIRRAELEAVRPVPGELPWGGEPIGNGRWSGVPLREILSRAGVEAGGAHVEMLGIDRVERAGRIFGFGGSIPLEKAMGPEVLLADRLNGEPLPAAHGFPIRAVVPGFYGARSVKWLGEIVVRETPSDNYFQTHAYRVQRVPSAEDPRDVRGGTALGELVLNSAITVPAAGAHLRTGPTTVSGWATGPGGTPPSRVELSGDGGQTWRPATLGGEGAFAWRQWEVSVKLAPGRHQLVARAFDREGRGQPAELAEVWNVKGYANNAWHRVTVSVAD